ncbi:hypothetical protein HNR33_000433 [Brassicibacter mesophilus]
MNILCEYILSVLIARTTVSRALNLSYFSATAASSVGQTNVKSDP